jgi:hypothetical protein
MQMLFALASFIYLSATAPAVDTPHIAIGSVQLQLGEPKEAVVARLLRYYDILDGGGVVEKENHVHLLGRVGFKNDRLAIALRNWSPSERQGDYKYAQAMVGAIRQMVSEGRQQCTLDISHGQAPEEPDFQGAAISCGSKRLEISTIVYDGTTHANLFEVLGESRQ